MKKFYILYIHTHIHIGILPRRVTLLVSFIRSPVSHPLSTILLHQFFFFSSFATPTGKTVLLSLLLLYYNYCHYYIYTFILLQKSFARFFSLSFPRGHNEQLTHPFPSMYMVWSLAPPPHPRARAVFWVMTDYFVRFYTWGPVV